MNAGGVTVVKSTLDGRAYFVAAEYGMTRTNK